MRDATNANGASAETRRPGRPAADLLPEVPLEPIPAVLDVEEMCGLFRVSRAVLYRAIAAEHVPRARAIGGSRWWLGAEVVAALKARLAEEAEE